MARSHEPGSAWPVTTRNAMPRVRNACVILHDATPRTISGEGARRLEAYGADILLPGSARAAEIARLQMLE